ncbi:MAG: alpha/beta hydrolase [Polyangiaceae bacterium]|nr:alpha/beta hydrolase [Polyangiaceae bacterium]
MEVQGEGRRSILLVHGTPLDRSTFAEVARRAPDGVRVVLLDLPDHGQAADQLEARLEPLEDALLDALQHTRGETTLVGHSIGAWLGARVSQRLPASVTRFVSLAGFAGLSPSELEFRRQLCEQLERGEVEVPSLRETVLDMMLGDARTPEADKVTWRGFEVPKSRIIRALRRMLRIADAPAVRFMRATTFVHGLRDGTVPHVHSAQLAREDADSTLVSLDTGSHVLSLSHPAEVAHIVFDPGKAG